MNQKLTNLEVKSMRRKTDDKIILQMLEEGHTQKHIAEHFDVSPAAICKRAKRLEAYPKSINDLTPQQQRFVQSIAEGKSQTQSAIDAYEVSSIASAKALGSALMKKPEISSAVSEWMNYHGLTKDYRVQKLKKHVDNRDPNISLKALDQSWKLDNSYNEPKFAVQINYAEMVAERQTLEQAREDALKRKEALEKAIAEKEGKLRK